TASSTAAPSATLAIALASWQLPAPRSRAVALPSDHAMLLIGGLDAGQSSTARVWHIALPGGTTTRLAVLPQAVHDAAGAELGGAAYVFGGGEATTIATVQRYQAGSADVAGQMPQSRSDLVAAAIGGTAYVLGGFDGTNGVPDVLATTDGTTFRTAGRLAETVRYPALAVIGGRIYLFGGEHDGNNITSVQMFDPATGAVSVVAQLPEPLAHASAVVLDGQVLLIGGRSHGRILDTVMRFDPATGHVEQVGRLPYAVADAGAAVVDGVAYVVGGETPGVVASAITLRHV
ncbi:MAG TPA: kelch repeat-containing protein, partial [Acidimicrobiia bacterium]|nr:kelch repeat-containing protein [Acidimicrobiia bacterium]